MGEFAKYKGQSIKIGTRENLYYLRPDQIALVEPIDGNTNPFDFQSGQDRFRFPFPDEDHRDPGDFEPFRTIDVPTRPPAEIRHSHVNYRAESGAVIQAPCPWDETAQSAKWVNEIDSRHAKPVVKIEFFKWDRTHGRWNIVCHCADCGAMWRFDSLADPEMEALLETLCQKAIQGSDHIATDSPAYWHSIIGRILLAYHEPAEIQLLDTPRTQAKAIKLGQVECGMEVAA